LSRRATTATTTSTANSRRNVWMVAVIGSALSP
jgi:hypothetical protein